MDAYSRKVASYIKYGPDFSTITHPHPVICVFPNASKNAPNDNFAVAMQFTFWNFSRKEANISSLPPQQICQVVTGLKDKRVHARFISVIGSELKIADGAVVYELYFTQATLRLPVMNREEQILVADNLKDIKDFMVYCKRREVMCACATQPSKRLYCGACKRAGQKFTYCNLDCQKADWAEHRHICASKMPPLPIWQGL